MSGIRKYREKKIFTPPDRDCYVILAGLILALYPRLASNPKHCFLPLSPSTGIQVFITMSSSQGNLSSFSCVGMHVSTCGWVWVHDKELFQCF